MTTDRPGHQPGASAPQSSPVDWGLARQVARRVARRKSSPADTIDPVQIAPMALVAEERIGAMTGLRSASGPATIQVIDRDEWIDANIASFQRLLAPLFQKWAERAKGTRKAATAATRRITAVELGALLGWMSTRVLGQYDMLLGESDSDGAAAAPDAVYLVGPNIVGLERRFGFAPEEFRLWVTTHELTHRAQFTGVPWMRGHFLDLVQQSLTLADPDPAALGRALRDAMRDRAELRRRMADGGLVAVVATPEQREALARIGGMMSLLEGHGDVTMDRAVADLAPSAARFSGVLRARRERANPLARLVLKLSGLEAKFNQYLAGERFIAAIEAAAGPRAVDVCWRDPQNLPTLDEVRVPQRWLERLHGSLAFSV